MVTSSPYRRLDRRPAKARELLACEPPLAMPFGSRGLAHDDGTVSSGNKFFVSGEPLTESKRLSSKSRGYAIPGYGARDLRNRLWLRRSTPNGRRPRFASPSAVIQQSSPLDANGLAVYPFLFTTLSPLGPMLHINVENGDYGVMETRDCGCALEKAGLTLHLHQIRSFEKFTSEGMNYFYGDLYEIFEGDFPSEFGGSPGDYQLVEEEDDNGQTRLTLVVHPDVGELDEEDYYPASSCLCSGSRNNRFMTRSLGRCGNLQGQTENSLRQPARKDPASPHFSGKDQAPEQRSVAVQESKGMNVLVTNTQSSQSYAIIRALRPYAQKIVATMEGGNRFLARLAPAANSRLVDRRYYVPSPSRIGAGNIKRENTAREEAFIQAMARSVGKKRST